MGHQSWENYYEQQEAASINEANDDLVDRMVKARIVFDRACIVEDEIYVLRADRMYRVFVEPLAEDHSSSPEEDFDFTVSMLADDLRGQPSCWWEGLLFYLRTHDPVESSELFGLLRRRLEVGVVPFRERIMNWQASGRLTSPSIFDPSLGLVVGEARLDAPPFALSKTKDPALLDPGCRLQRVELPAEFGETRDDYWRDR